MLREPAIDAILSPYHYGADGRNYSMPLVPHGVIDSARLHGKLHVIEDDSRTALCTDRTCYTATGKYGDGIVASRTISEMISKAQTNVLTAALHGLGVYFYDIPGDGWYGRPDKAAETQQFWRAMGDLRQRLAAPVPASAATLAPEIVPAHVPEIALLVDDMAISYFQLSGGPGKQCQNRPSSTDSTADMARVRAGWYAGCSLSAQLHAQPAHALQWTGMPFRQYLLSDVLLPSFPADQLRFVIFANALQMRPDILNATKTKLSKPLQDGSKRALLFIWAPAFLDGSGSDNYALDADGPARLLGMNLKLGAGAQPLVTQLVSPPPGEPGVTAFGQPDYSIAPWLHGGGDDTAAANATRQSSLCGVVSATEVLGHFNHSAGSSLLRGVGERCTTIFSATPGLPAALYSQLAANAGVHRYLSGGSALNVTVEVASLGHTGSILMLHCGNGDGSSCAGMTMTLRSTVQAIVADDLEGAMPTKPVCTNCRQVTCTPLAAGAVRLYWLQDKPAPLPLKTDEATALEFPGHVSPKTDDNDESAASTPPAGKFAPRSWWRFEDPLHIGFDTMGNHDLHPVTGKAPETIETPIQKAAGGIVGGFIQLNPGGDSNLSWSANASYLPLQCANPRFRNGLILDCPKDDPMLCANGHCPRGITIELLIKLGPDALKQGNLTLFETPRYGITNTWVDIGRHRLSFRAVHSHIGMGLGASDGWEMIRPRLNGTGRSSTNYLQDGEWHHLVFRRDAGGMHEPSTISIWVDGQNPDSGGRCELFTKIDADRPNECWSASGNSSGYMGNFSDRSTDDWRSELLVLPTAFDGAVDEIAVYEQALPDDVIYAHYQSAIEHKRPYSFESPAAPAPAPQDIHGNFSLLDYAPGTIMPTAGVNTQGVNISARDQLGSFPCPRYSNKVSAAMPALLPLGWSFIPGYIIGENQPFGPLNKKMNASEYVDAVVDVVRVLSVGFGYSLVYPFDFNCRNMSDPACGLSCDQLPKHPQFANQQAYPGKAWCNLLTEHKDVGIEIFISRMAAHSHQVGALGSNAAGNQSLPDACYLQNAKNQFFSYKGAPVNCSGCSSKYKVIRPLVSSAETLCPDRLFAPDGEGFARALESLSRVTGNVGKVTRFWNDGEQFGSVLGGGALSPHRYFEDDPVIVEDYEHAGIPPFDPSGARDWTTYISKWRSRFTSSFRDVVLAQNPQALYSEYGVAGDWPFGTLLWPEMRKIMTPQNAARHGQRYSTPSIYPGASGPSGWDISSDGGLDQLSVLRPTEIAAGDLNFAPFVAAGWQNAEERTIRPGAWLGFLKSLSAMGAEYMTTGYFNARANGKSYHSNCTSHGTPPPNTELCPFQLAQNYVWQAVIPSYAQAITSLWRPLLFDGELMVGDMPLGRVSWGCGHAACDYSTKFPQKNDGRPGTGGWMKNRSHYPEPVNWRFWAGSEDAVVFVRKLKTASMYLISGAILPQSNVAGNTPVRLNVTINLAGQKLLFEVRRQGSVYSLSTDAKGTPTTFVQLDGWHEGSHPSHWSTSFKLEAELHDDALFGQHNEHIYSEMIQQAADKQTYDLRVAASYLVLSESKLHRLSFEPRRVHPITATVAPTCNYSVMVRLRGQSCVNIALSTRSHETAVGVACVNDSGLWHECVVAAGGGERGHAVVVATTGEQSAILVSSLSDSQMDLDLVHLLETTRPDLPLCSTVQDARTHVNSVLKTDDTTAWPPERAEVVGACSQSSHLKVHCADALVHVLPEDPFPAAGPTVLMITLAAARQQRVDFQLVLTSAAPDFRHVTVNAPDRDSDGITTPAVRLVSDVNVTLASNAAMRVGMSPDPLQDLSSSVVPASGAGHAVFWITINVPESAAASVIGKVAIKDSATGEPLCTVPYTVRVWDFKVPTASEASQTTRAQISLTYAVPANHVRFAARFTTYGTGLQGYSVAQASTPAGRFKVALAVGETVILPQPPLPSVGISIGMERGCSKMIVSPTAR